MDGSLIARRLHDDYWRPSGPIPRSRPQSGLNTARTGRQAAYLALWQQRQSRAQSSRPLGTPRFFVSPSRSGLQPRPPSSGLQPRPPSSNFQPRPPSSNLQPRPPQVPQPPSGPPPRPDARNPLLLRGRGPRRVLSSHFGGTSPVKEPDSEKRVRIVSPPKFETPEMVEASALPWRRSEEEVQDVESEEESEVDNEDENGVISDVSSTTPTPPPTPLRFQPRPPEHPRPDGVRSILKRARMREARLAPQTSYLPSPQHGPVPQETELTDILSIRPKPMIPHIGRDRNHAVEVSAERGVRFNMANTEVIEIARRRPMRPTIFPDSYRLS